MCICHTVTRSFCQPEEWAASTIVYRSHDTGDMTGRHSEMEGSLVVPKRHLGPALLCLFAWGCIFACQLDRGPSLVKQRTYEYSVLKQPAARRRDRHHTCRLTLGSSTSGEVLEVDRRVAKTGVQQLGCSGSVLICEWLHFQHGLSTPANKERCGWAHCFLFLHC